MLTRNKLFGILTGLVEEHRKTDNFFQALHFKANFFKINTIMNGITKKYENVEVKSCFDMNSDIEEQREFRYIEFVSIEGLSDYIKENYGELINEIQDNGKTVELTIK